jgi:hypothetical protein
MPSAQRASLDDRDTGDAPEEGLIGSLPASDPVSAAIDVEAGS